jgi:predicted nucleic acid-binding protein
LLVDTSILLRQVNPADARHSLTLESLTRLRQQGELLTVARQNFVEFRNAATRPLDKNGLGLTPQQADAELDEMEELYPRLPEDDGAYTLWRDLCKAAGVSGKQVHDTRLVAVCVTAGVLRVLTWNPSDFARFVPFVPGLEVLTPDDVLATL